MCLQQSKSVLRTASYLHICQGAAYGKIGRMLGGDNKNDLTNENQPMEDVEAENHVFIVIMHHKQSWWSSQLHFSQT